MKTILVSFALLSSSVSFAKDIPDVPQLGHHQQIFTVAKNVNPENIVIVYTKVDDKCRFVTDPANHDQPIFDFYWRMNGQDYKPMNSFFKQEFHRRMTYVDGGADRATKFQLDANDLKEVNHDLGPDPRLDVSAFAIDQGCDVQAFITLGPSDGNARIRIDSIFGEGTSFPPKVTAVTLKGEVVDKDGKGTGKMISRRYEGKK